MDPDILLVFVALRREGENAVLQDGASCFGVRRHVLMGAFIVAGRAPHVRFHRPSLLPSDGLSL